MKHPIKLNSRDLSLLVPEFRTKVEALVKACAAKGVTIVPYCTLIGPGREAELYCHSRTWAEVEPVKKRMQAQGASILADLFIPSLCLGRRGEWKSNALPGQSSHVWGQAVDCYVAGPDGMPNWNSAAPGYETYAREAERLKLTSGHRWKMRDSVHVQMLPVGEGPMFGAWREIERNLQERFNL